MKPTLWAAALALTLSGCKEPCGPAYAQVAEVIDGDTVRLDTGESVRYLLLDTPEITSGQNACYGELARDYNVTLVQGQTVALTYSAECTDRYGRLLAYVSAQGLDVNRKMIDEGLACVLYIPPAGAERKDEFLAAQETARTAGKGLWGACNASPCD